MLGRVSLHSGQITPGLMLEAGDKIVIIRWFMADNLTSWPACLSNSADKIHR